MTITYSLAPNPKWYIADMAGLPLGGGYMYTYSSLNKTVFKYVFQDASGNQAWGQPILFDENGSQGPFYWAIDSDDPEDLYYIEVYDINGVFQWSLDDFAPPGDGGGGTVTTNLDLENYVINNVMWRNFNTSPNPITSTSFKIAQGAHAGLALTAANYGPDIYFIKANTTATDILSFQPFTLGSNALTGDVTPTQFLRYVCSIAGVNDGPKYVQFPITQGVQNLSNTSVTTTIWARCNSGTTSLSLYWAQFFGDGVAPATPGSATVRQLIQTVTLTNAWAPYRLTANVPSVSSKTLGTCGNDGLFLQIQYPTDTTSIDIAKPGVFLGAVTPSLTYESYDMIEAMINTPRTGDHLITWNTYPIFGYVPANDGSIGNTGSGATNRADPDTFPLYNFLWNNFSDSWAPVSTGRGATAIADFCNGKTLTIPKNLGRVMAGLNAYFTSSVFTASVTTKSVTSVTAGSPGVFGVASTAGMWTGMPIQFNATGTLPTVVIDGANTVLSINTTYYIKVVDALTFNLGLSLKNIQDDELLEVVVGSTGTQPNTIINTNYVLTLSTSQVPALTAGTPLLFLNTGGSLPSGLSANTVYYVTTRSLAATTITVSDNLTNALAGYPIAILTAGTGTNVAYNAAGVSDGDSYTTDVAAHSHLYNDGEDKIYYEKSTVGQAVSGTTGTYAITFRQIPTEGENEVSIMQPTSFKNIFIKL